MITVIVIVYLLSMLICGLALYFIEYPSEDAKITIIYGNQFLIRLLIWVGSLIPVINTIIVIWLIYQTEIDD